MGNKYQGITSFEESGIYYVRVGNNFGWYAERNGKTYGHYMIYKDELNKDIIDQNFDLLRQQAEDTLKRI